MSSGQDRGIGRKPLLPHTTKRRITTILNSINKQPKAPENQSAWNSDNQGIKEKINQSNQTSKSDLESQLRKNAERWLRGRVDCGARWAESGGADLRGKLRLKADCGLRLGLPQWEFLPARQESSLKSRWTTLFPLWPLLHRQQGGLPWGGRGGDT